MASASVQVFLATVAWSSEDDDVLTGAFQAFGLIGDDLDPVLVGVASCVIDRCYAATTAAMRPSCPTRCSFRKRQTPSRYHRCYTRN